MEKAPAFQFYPSDFLSDENVVLMNNQEVGCYIKLLCFCWKQGSIPGDMAKIAKLCNEDENSMAQLWHSLKPCFIENGNDGRFYNKRLEKERKKQIEFKKERSESGYKGAVSRWGKKKKSKNSSAIAQPLREPMANHGPSSSSSSSIKNIYTSKFFENWWSEYPKKVGKKDCLKKWKSRRLDTIADTLIEDTKKRIKSKKWQDGFIPNPLTYINGDRWNDELEQQTQTKTPQQIEDEDLKIWQKNQGIQ
jgi:uncharacterized protein YdaU (DUF1376 family)